MRKLSTLSSLLISFPSTHGQQATTICVAGRVIEREQRRRETPDRWRWGHATACRCPTWADRSLRECCRLHRADSSPVGAAADGAGAPRWEIQRRHQGGCRPAWSDDGFHRGSTVPSRRRRRSPPVEAATSRYLMGYEGDGWSGRATTDLVSDGVEIPTEAHASPTAA
jgi:hypothetical protein